MELNKPTMTIREIIARDLTKRIEEVVKVEQEDEATVHGEITDYVPTDRIKDHYRRLFQEIAEAKNAPHDGIGIWVSGFFGSGKSSFAKNLGYVLSNPTVLGTSAAELFKQQIGDSQTSALIDNVLSRIKTDSILFDVRAHTSALRGDGRITELMYAALLRELGYASDFDLAELEIGLEIEGKLDAFTALCQNRYGIPWTQARGLSQSYNRASALLFELDPNTYATTDSWAMQLKAKRVELTVGKFVDRLYELTARRRPGRTLFFVLDEVGAYVARSAEKIEDLRSLVERIGMVGKTRVQNGQFAAPVWVVVTSQEKLDEIVAAIDSKRVELARLQDRFKLQVDLAPADIREVASKRVLPKTDAGKQELEALYARHSGLLNTTLEWEQTSRVCKINQAEFVQFYPYPPHFVDLSIDIMSGIRLQPGAQRQIGGSNRTIIKQAYEMLVSEKTQVASLPVGALVTLDRLYDLVEGSIASEKQLDINKVRTEFLNHPDDPNGWTLRTVKVICLLEFVRGLPRSEKNIAACLVDHVGEAAPLAEIKKALARLETGQHIRQTDQGWKLQTAYEKQWDTKRRGFEAKPRERNELLRETLKVLFEDPDLKTFRHRQKTFRLAVTLDGVRIGDDGDIPLALVVAEGIEDLPAKRERAKVDSRQPAHENCLFWAFAQNPEIETLMGRLYASRQMVQIYEQERAQSRISNEDAALLQAEKTEEQQLRGRLRDKVQEALWQGVGLFRGAERDGPTLGITLAEALRAQVGAALPDLYPRFELGVATFKAGDIEVVLTAANLNGLPAVYYDGGLKLVGAQAGGKQAVDPNAPIAREVLGFLQTRHAYGDKVTGKLLDEHFTGLGYGWERSVVQLTLAALLRGGAVEVTYQGRRYRSHNDPLAREPFTNQTAFKSASFAPRAAIDLKTLTTAVRYLEEMTGEEVDIEEGAIASGFRSLCEEEQRRLLPLLAQIRANGLPGGEALTEYQTTLTGALTAPSDDCVRMLAEEGKSLQESRQRLLKAERALDADGLALLARARKALDEVAPLLKTVGNLDVEALRVALADPDLYGNLRVLRTPAEALWSEYSTSYITAHEARAEAIKEALKAVKEHRHWIILDPHVSKEEQDSPFADELKAARESLLAPITAHNCAGLILPEGGLVCRTCRASLRELELVGSSLPALTDGILRELDRQAVEAEKVEAAAEEASGDGPILLAGYFPEDTLDSEEAIDAALGALRAELIARLQAGKTVRVL